MHLHAKVLGESDVADITGVKKNTLRHLVVNGILKPTGGGQGFHRRYSLLDAVAVAHGHAHREAGGVYEWMVNVVEFVANLDPEAMEAAFAEGKTMVVAVPDYLGGPFLAKPSKRLTQNLDLQVCFRNVIGAAKRLKPERNQRGRSRGMATAGS